MAYENIIVETREHVGLITLDRPKALNALNAALMRELGEALLADSRGPEALDAFRKAAAIEPDYREVSKRIDQLS